MNILGRNSKRYLDVVDVTAESVTADQGTFKRLRVGDAPYDLPESKGSAGQVPVQQSDGTVLWGDVSDAGTAVREAEILDVFSNVNWNTGYIHRVDTATSANFLYVGLDNTARRSLFNSADPLPIVPTWSSSAAAVVGRSFAWIEVTLPPVASPLDSEFVMRVNGRFGGGAGTNSDLVPTAWIQLQANAAPTPDAVNPSGLFYLQSFQPTLLRQSSTNAFNKWLFSQQDVIIPSSYAGTSVRIGVSAYFTPGSILTPIGFHIQEVWKILVRNRGWSGVQPFITSHLNLTDIGTNTHASLDSHVASTSLHWDGTTKTMNSNENLYFGNVTAGILSPANSTLELFATNSIFLNGTVTVRIPANLRFQDAETVLSRTGVGALNVRSTNSLSVNTLTTTITTDQFFEGQAVQLNVLAGTSGGDGEMGLGSGSVTMDTRANDTFFATRWQPTNREVVRYTTGNDTYRISAPVRLGASAPTDYALPTARALGAKYVMADLLGNGTATWSSLASVTGGYFYGDAYFQSNATPTTFGAINTYTPVLGTMVANLTSSFSLQGNALRNDSAVTRTYKIDVSGSIIAGGNNDEIYQLAVYVGGVLATSSQVRTKLDNVANSYPINFALACLSTVAPTNLVQVYARNTISTQSLLVIDLSLTVVNVSL